MFILHIVVVSEEIISTLKQPVQKGSKSLSLNFVNQQYLRAHYSGLNSVPFMRNRMYPEAACLKHSQLLHGQ